MIYTSSFKPSKIPSGKSVGIFKGWDVKTGSNPVKDKDTKKVLLDEDNQPVMRDWVNVQLQFEFRSDRPNLHPPKIFSLNTWGGDVLVDTLTAMGWVNDVVENTELLETAYDEFGQPYERIVGTEYDEFGAVILPDDVLSQDELIEASMEAFVKSVVGKPFVCSLFQNKRKYWEVSPNTIEIFTPKSIVV